MIFVATFKPKTCRDWSYYCRLRMDVAPGENDAGEFDGTWSVMGGPFFPFSKEYRDQQSSGVWCYGADAGRIGFFAPDTEERYLLFWPVHWNFRVICAHRELQGIGETAHQASPND